MITFGICTYNRKDILLKSAKSLLSINGIEKVNIRIFDDCSDEYDYTFLRDLFPTAATIIRQKTNVGADKNTSIMYEYFLNTDDEWLFNADSDLIYRRDIVGKLKSIINDQKKFATLFNCINHETIEKCDDYEKKESVGAAGCFLHRDVVKMILDNIQTRNIGFDVRFSKLLQKNGFPLYATKESYVQHIGVSGFNSRDINFDYGKNFSCDSQLNADIIEETFEQYINSIQQYKKRPQWKIYYFIVSVPRRIKRIIRLIKELLKNEQH